MQHFLTDGGSVELHLYKLQLIFTITKTTFSPRIPEWVESEMGECCEGGGDGLDLILITGAHLTLEVSDPRLINR